MAKARIISFEVDTSKRIKLNVEYSVNGKKLINPYLIDARQLVGKSAEQVTQFVDAQINFQLEQYIEAEFRAIKNTEYVQSDLQVLVEKVYEKETMEMKLENGSTIVVKADGTFTAKG